MSITGGMSVCTLTMMLAGRLIGLCSGAEVEAHRGPRLPFHVRQQAGQVLGTVYGLWAHDLGRSINRRGERNIKIALGEQPRPMIWKDHHAGIGDDLLLGLAPSAVA